MRKVSNMLCSSSMLFYCALILGVCLRTTKVRHRLLESRGDSSCLAFTDVIVHIGAQTSQYAVYSLQACLRRGAEMLAYPPVVAAGERANTIHYLQANQDIGTNDCVLMDAGCDLNGYVSDITRCFPISGSFSSVQRTLYDALLRVHEQLLVYANEAPKLRLSNLYSRMVELLSSAVSRFQVAESLCPHHVSHYLGMDVHDCASVSRDIDVPPGTVFTIEPGIYIPKNSRFPEEFQGVGLRIEDDVVTTGDGIEVLSEAAPRSANEIEYLMRSH
ncbi:unnamed protein product [Heligmosomoides polygyrus]|uniref:Peptidase_M24 domain-containing protein n=1 Tax=Heligmosomoides polygyrus TaxID=6339 RepID=A0A183FST3_HELPZ|nr:unnamed protein product [Heligmosomoides polygyrus]